MDRVRRIAELMKGFQNNGQVFFNAIVESVEGNSCTIRLDDISIQGVRLKPTTEKTDDEFIAIPAKGSYVLVGSFSGDFNNLFVLQTDTVSELKCKIGGITYHIDKDGIVFNEGKNGGLMNIKDVVSWMEKVYDDMTKIAAGLAGVPYTFLPTTPIPMVRDFEDTKVKH